MRYRMLLLTLILWFGAAQAQNEWVLEPYAEIIGSRRNQVLGCDVSRTGDLNSDGKLDLSASDLAVTGIYDAAALQAKIPHLKFRGLKLRKGDFNGDGFTDVVVRHWVVYEDTLRVYFGSSAGIDTISDLVIPGERQYDNFGAGMAVGDLNGDGFDDLVVTAPQANTARGKIYVYMGNVTMDGAVDYMAIGESIESCLGEGCAAGDLNNDGYDDVAVSGTVYHDGEEIFRYINIYFGGRTFDLIADLRMTDENDVDKRFRTPGLQIFDTNGDGLKDLLVGGFDKRMRWWRLWQAVFIYYGARNFDTIADFELTNPDTNITCIADFGKTLANAGDINGDGYDDILVGAPGSFQSGGFVFVYSGGKSLDNKFDAGIAHTYAGYFGGAIDGIGDINGDGLGDIAIGEPDHAFDSRVGYFGVFLGDRRIPSDTTEKPKPEAPTRFELLQNYPNPFNGTTVIGYSLKDETFVKLIIFDILGREVRRLVDQKQSVGYYQVQWDGKDNQGRDVGSGKYLYRLQANGFSDAKEMTLVR